MSSNASLLTRPTIPFAEAPWHQGLPNPLYSKKSHFELREWVRNWVDENLADIVDQWESDKSLAAPTFQKFAKAGFLLPFSLGVRIPQRFFEMAEGLKLPGSVAPEDWDNVHDFIMIDELCRCGSSGLFMSAYGGAAYGSGPIVHYASEELQKRILPDVLTGKKRICLAITEPNAGSDVANITTSAVKSECGKFYLVSGIKKWITNGIWSDWFTTAVRTSGKAGDHKGISFLVVPRTEGLSTKTITMQSAGSGTTLLEMDNVKVPVENLIGKEGEAFKYIMGNFNHERMTIAYVALRFSRVCIEDATAHVTRRIVFGKPLIDNPAVRIQLAHMARETEALQAWVEALVYQQMMLGSRSELLTGGSVALLKAHAGIVVSKVARESGLLLGGMGLTRGGTGARIERIYREVNGLCTPGGAELVMLDAGMRQAAKTIKMDPTKSKL